MELSRFETRLIVPECQARMAMAGDVPLDPLPLDLDASTGVRDRIVAEALTIGATGSVDVSELIVDPPTIEAVDASVEATVPELEDPVIPAIASPSVDAAVAAEEAATAAQVAADDAAILAPAPQRRPRGRMALCTPGLRHRSRPNWADLLDARRFQHRP